MFKDRKLFNGKSATFSVAVLLMIAVTYWLVARPYFATKSCQKVALDNTGYERDSWQSWAGKQSNQTAYMFVYELCMQKEGINP